jgi:hypothetical protein
MITGLGSWSPGQVLLRCPNAYLAAGSAGLLLEGWRLRDLWARLERSLPRCTNAYLNGRTSEWLEGHRRVAMDPGFGGVYQGALPKSTNVRASLPGPASRLTRSPTLPRCVRRDPCHMDKIGSRLDLRGA